jgi:hypothetical protein
MIRIMSDNDVRGNVGRLLEICRASPWGELWTDLDVDVCTFMDLGLAESASDAAVWRACQQNGVVLITGNRNADGPDSLEVTIRNENSLQCLPVLTISDRDRIARDRRYAESVLERLIEFLIDLEALRGAGRLFLP